MTAPRRKKWMVAAIPAVLIGPMLFGCASRQTTATADAPATTSVQPTPAAPAAPAAPTRAANTGIAPKDFTALDPMKDVHFDFDRDTIRKADAAILDGNASWLKANSQRLVLVEGHADERGTNEYNLALGDRRSKAAMNYLVSRGVSASRITVVTYGEDRPLCREHTEECWAKNRRGHVLAKAQ